MAPVRDGSASDVDSDNSDAMSILTVLETAVSKQEFSPCGDGERKGICIEDRFSKNYLLCAEAAFCVVCCKMPFGSARHSEAQDEKFALVSDFMETRRRGI